MPSRVKFRDLPVYPRAAMQGKKCIERHGGEWWVCPTVYSLLLTDYSLTIKSLSVKEAKR